MIQKKIKFEENYIHVFIIISTITGVVSGIFHAIPLEDDEDIFYPLVIFEEIAPENLKNMLNWIYRISFLVMPVVMLAPFHITIFAINIIRTQLLLLLEVLKKINQGYDTSNDLFNNSEYQKEIKKRLKTCIIRHTELSM